MVTILGRDHVEERRVQRTNEIEPLFNKHFMAFSYYYHKRHQNVQNKVRLLEIWSKSVFLFLFFKYDRYSLV